MRRPLKQVQMRGAREESAEAWRSYAAQANDRATKQMGLFQRSAMNSWRSREYRC